jgi:hypothetical protein
MLLPSILTVLPALYAAQFTWAVGTIPPKIYGVNLGSWYDQTHCRKAAEYNR